MIKPCAKCQNAGIRTTGHRKGEACPSENIGKPNVQSLKSQLSQQEVTLHDTLLEHIPTDSLLKEIIVNRPRKRDRSLETWLRDNNGKTIQTIQCRENPYIDDETHPNFGTPMFAWMPEPRTLDSVSSKSFSTLNGSRLDHRGTVTGSDDNTVVFEQGDASYIMAVVD